MSITVNQGLSMAREIYNNRSRRILELRKAGKKILGYICLYPPVEIITALGLVPFRVFGDMSEPITAADRISSTVVCPFLRSIIDLGIKGRFDFLDGIVGAHTCDIGMTIVVQWRDFITDAPFTHYIDVPHTDHEPAVAYFEEQLHHFKEHIESLAGEKLTEDKLKGAIELHNRQRKLVRELYNLRKPDPPLLDSMEILQVLVSLFSLPVDEGNQLLSEVIEEVKTRKAGPAKKQARLLVWGPVYDNTALYKLIEDAGANVVVDDTCVGSRGFWSDVKPPYNMLALARRYLVDLKCPRTYRDAAYQETSRDYNKDLDSRFNYIRKAVTDWGVNGAVLQSVEYCDTHGYEVPNVRHYLHMIGIPSIYIEHAYSERSLASIKTRIEAFLETLQNCR